MFIPGFPLDPYFDLSFSYVGDDEARGDSVELDGSHRASSEESFELLGVRSDPMCNAGTSVGLLEIYGRAIRVKV